MSMKNTEAGSKQEYFKLFRDCRELFLDLTAEQVGRLIRAVIAYGNRGVEPELDDELMMYFVMMKLQIDKDAERYENRCRQNSINASKRYAGKPPTKEKAAAYFKEESFQSDPEYFFDYYEARGWCVNQNPIKDWKALARIWEKNSSRNGKAMNEKPSVLEYLDPEA